MAWYSKATRRTVAWANAITRKKGYKGPNVVVLHIAVTARSAKSLYGYFTGGGKGVVCSHFFVADDGTVEQYIDTARRSSADYSGGDRTISIETAGGSGADLSKGWSAAQREAIAQILAWAHKTHGIPLRAMSSSKASERGVGYHRLGVPATYAQKNAGRSMTGGELWSGAVGKVCPGDARIKQIPGIIARAVEIAGGKPSGGGASKPVPAPSKPSGKSIATMASEVIAGKHGNGHAQRQKSLGISAGEYAKVRAEVNRRVSGGGSSKPAASKPAGKSIATMAAEVVAGKHGNGHAARRKSLGVSAATYAKVRAEVNRRVSGSGKSAAPAGKSVAQMATEVIQGKHGNGHATRRKSLGISAAQYAKVRAEVNRRV